MKIFLNFQEKRALILILLEHNYKNDSRIIKEIKILTEKYFNIILFFCGELYRKSPEKINRNSFAINIHRLENIRKYISCLKSLKPVAVHCHDFYTIPYGIMLKESLGAKLVYDSHEIWGYKSVNKELFQSIFIRTIDSFYLKHLDYIIFVNDIIVKFQQKKHNLHPKKLFCVKNTAFQTQSKEKILRKEHPQLAGKKIIIYVGAIQKARGIGLILDTAESLSRTNPDIHFVFLGSQNPPEFLSKFKLPKNLTVLPPVPPEKISSYTADCDLGLCIIEPVDLSYKYSSATKLFDYISAGLPALYSNIPFHRMLARKFGTGIIVEKLSSKSLKKSILDFFDMDKVKVQKIKGNCKNSKKIFCFSSDGKILLDMYSKIISNPFHAIKRVEIYNEQTNNLSYNNKNILIFRSAPPDQIEHHLRNLNKSNCTLLCQKSYVNTKGFKKVLFLLPDRMFKIIDILRFQRKQISEFDLMLLPSSDVYADGMIPLSLLALFSGAISYVLTADGKMLRINIKTIFLIFVKYYRIKDKYLTSLKACLRLLKNMIFHKENENQGVF